MSSSEVSLSVEDCLFIKSFYNKNFEIDSTTPNFIRKKNGTIAELRYRISNKAYFCSIDNSTLLEFLTVKLKPLGVKNISSVRIMKYKKGCTLAKHRDSNSHSRYTGSKPNLLSISIQLTDSSKYEGGDLIVEDQYQSRKIGSVSSFTANQEHEVTVVTNGTRYSVIMYLTEDQLDLKKTLF